MRQLTYLPLEGVRVLDLAKLIPGDLATRRLADLGAEVVKCEPPGRGDYLRYIGAPPGGVSPLFLALNRNKKSIAVDLDSPEGRELFGRLADVADVIVEVSIPGRLLRQGIDLAALRRKRPELVICSITGFGQTGPLAPLPSHGMSMDALCGVAPIVDGPDGPQLDLSLGVSLASEFGAVNAALAILAALFAARHTGQGAWIDVSCWDAGAELHRSSMMAAAQDGSQRKPLGDIAALYSVYVCADDRPVLFCAIERKFFKAFCDAVDRRDLLEMAHRQNQAVDFGASQELRSELEKVFRREPAPVWMDRFVEWGVPGSLVHSGSDLLEYDHTVARGLIEPNWIGTMPNILDPIRWMDDGSRPGANATVPGDIGADQEEVLAGWLEG